MIEMETVFYEFNLLSTYLPGRAAVLIMLTAMYVELDYFISFPVTHLSGR